VTDFPVVNVHADELSSARIWQHKLCVTFSANVNINYCLPIKVYCRICTLKTYQNQNNSWKPECVLSFNMGWQILVFYPNIRQPMLKLKTHSGFHDLFLNSNMTSFFRFVDKRAIYRWYNLIRTCAGECDWPFHWQDKLCATFSANVNINYHLPIKVYYHICTLRHIRIEINHGSQNVFLSFNMGLAEIGRGIKFTNICQPMLKLKTHSGFDNLFLNYNHTHLDFLVQITTFPSYNISCTKG
jgi:hypothetical protein